MDYPTEPIEFTPTHQYKLRKRLTSFAREGAMNQEIIAINLATVQMHFDAEKAGDWEKIKSMYTDEIIWERPA